ncbi:hypothetical protein Sango_2689700 [Sesamum angolense]|uniref:Uncharacterized protein n=1 Tax=Sesamum angolense TaxID=2727404 RepID=A0AAE1W2S8_9LAMI|nr:hypothetical protein Sango_2689700 [Sesamum angolense]
MSFPSNANHQLSSNELFTSLIAELQQQLKDSNAEMEKLKSDISRHAYYQQRAERRADQLDRKNSILRWEIGALKADHKGEVEQLQQENQQLRDQVDDLREHIDQLAEMIPDEPEENPEEDPMEFQDDDGELTEGSIIDGEYLANGTRPDISFSVSKLARYTSCPDKTHWGALDRVLRYLKGTVSLAIHYGRFPAVLEGYSDASWIAKNSRSNGCSGYVFTLGGGAVSSKSAKQTLITRSTFEAELCVLDTTGTEAEWLFGLLSQLPIVSQPLPPIAVHCDSQTTIAKVRSRKYNQKTKRHIQVRLKSIRALVSDRVIGIDFVGTKDNVADPLTKGLDLSQADHKGEVEQLQQENQQLYDQVDDLREHIDQLAEMIPDEPEENPEEDPTEFQDDDGELTEGSIIDGEPSFAILVFADDIPSSPSSLIPISPSSVDEETQPHPHLLSPIPPKIQASTGLLSPPVRPPTLASPPPCHLLSYK